MKGCHPSLVTAGDLVSDAEHTMTQYTDDWGAAGRRRREHCWSRCAGSSWAQHWTSGGGRTGQRCGAGGPVANGRDGESGWAGGWQQSPDSSPPWAEAARDSPRGEDARDIETPAPAARRGGRPPCREPLHHRRVSGLVTASAPLGASAADPARQPSPFSPPRPPTAHRPGP